MVNNLELIKPLLVFPDKDTFYVAEIIMRKKENPDLGSNSRVVKSYYIESISYLEDRWSEITRMCDALNARANIYLAAKSYDKTSSLHLKKLGEMSIAKSPQFVPRMYHKAVNKANKFPDNSKSWIIDVDDMTDASELEPIKEALKILRPMGNKIIATIPSKTGFHLITKRFDTTEFNKENSRFSIHKSNPTNLYIP